MSDKIIVRGAREHNLKNIDVEIPRGSLTVVTGVSGSGKSTLAFDTLYAEGQRRYIESLSTYAKQFLERIGRPDVDDVTGLSPAIAIEQRNTTRSSRSTVGTATEIYDYLRLLFARLGRTVCPSCNIEVKRHTPDEVIEALLASHRGRTLMVIASRKVEKGTAAKQIDEMIREGYSRFIIRGEVVKLEAAPKNASRLPTIDLVLDRIEIEDGKRSRLLEAIEAAYRMTDGHVRFEDVEGGKPALHFTHHLICTSCGKTFEEPRPILFSFNTPYGACPSCRGFGSRLEFDDALIIPDPSRALKDHAIEPWASEKFEYFFDQLVRFCRRKKIPMNVAWAKLPESARRAIMEGSGEFVGVLPFLENMREKTYKKYARFFTRRYLAFRECRACEAGRLRPEAFYVRLGGKTIRDVGAMSPGGALEFVKSLELSERDATIARDVVIELESRLGFLLAVGLHYITLDRLARTLSGGESQRISLANSLGSNLLDVLYVLDEPSIGLHPRDTTQLIEVLAELRARGNTVVVVEHDLDIIRAADYIVDLGPGAGELGGEVVYQGPPDAKNGNIGTLKYLRDGLPMRPVSTAPAAGGRNIRLLQVREHNLKNIDVEFPLHAFTSVTGVSGSGKSTLVCDVLHHALRSRGESRGASYRAIEGIQQVRGVLMVDQTPIGKTPRSNPVTYVRAFATIRETFAAQKKAQKRGYASGRFSFNVAGGRCARCQGMGFERIEMHFMADMFVRCSECEGKRFNQETLEITYRGLDLAQVLELTVDHALVHFADHADLVSKLRVLSKVGLGYLRLGQPSTTLSGGESQRIKIARELAENHEGGYVYILDEPTTGLHVQDVETLIDVLRELQQKGNTVIVVEHNLQVIAQSDHVIDLGPEGGDGGGRIVAAGTPEDIMRAADSHTGVYLSRFGRGTRRRAS